MSDNYNIVAMGKPEQPSLHAASVSERKCAKSVNISSGSGPDLAFRIINTERSSLLVH